MMTVDACCRDRSAGPRDFRSRPIASGIQPYAPKMPATNYTNYTNQPDDTLDFVGISRQ
ncbi:MAG TPA: hypothetical protein VKM56_12790 [Verrucomicrobiae bacterium]|nr:hypothetical protein [Verrucomicrobiae bacterium]